jgi:hypothetical protein
LIRQIRCIYRLIEFAEGMNGYAFRHEWLFWLFESLPMLFAIGVFLVWHPHEFLGKRAGEASRMNAKATSRFRDVESSSGNLN